MPRLEISGQEGGSRGSGFEELAEPSAWDWFKSLLRLDPIPIPDSVSDTDTAAALRSSFQEVLPSEEPREFTINWAHVRLPLGIILAVIAQLILETPDRMLWLSGIFYAGALGLVIWAQRSDDFLITLPKELPIIDNPINIRLPFLSASLIFSLMTFVGAGNNLLNLPLFLIWLAAILCTLLAFWQGDISLQKPWTSIRDWFAQPTLAVSGWTLLLIGAFLISAFLRFYRLNEIPSEMWSDHAEKLLDVADLLDGRTAFFFPRNTGREMIQFYLAAATAKWLGTGISFTTLKIGTAVAGLLTLPFIYLFAKEYGGRYLGLAAMFLAGVAYWPNVISRVGLRFPFFPLFVAPSMYFLIRGLRTKSMNDFLLCGVAVGIGLHGYSPIRVLPLVIAAGVLIYMIHSPSKGYRSAAIRNLILAGVVALVIILPLLRVAISIPDYFLMRMTSRIYQSGLELSQSPVLIFIENMLDSSLMFNVDSGQIWVVSIPNRPALDWITGALLVLGFGMVVFGYLKQRRWQDLFLLISVPMLMLPSTLAIVFPGENPAPNRLSGVLVPIFTIAAFPLAALPSWSQNMQSGKTRSWIGYALSVLLLFVLALNNFRLVNTDYADQFREKAWNTSEAGNVIRGFTDSIGSYDTAHVIAYPHWLDTRLVGITAGQPRTDFGIWPEALEGLPSTQEAQLFILNVNDEIGLNELREQFPEGTLTNYQSAVNGRDFFIYFVPSSLPEGS